MVGEEEEFFDKGKEGLSGGAMTGGLTGVIDGTDMRLEVGDSGRTGLRGKRSMEREKSGASFASAMGGREGRLKESLAARIFCRSCAVTKGPRPSGVILLVEDDGVSA